MWRNLFFAALQRLIPYRWSLLMALATAFIIALVVPEHKGFKYQFAKDRPWQYELLTAPYDFHVYKSGEQIKREKDSVERAFIPIYTKGSEVGEMALSELQETYSKQFSQQLPIRYYNYLQARLSSIYKQGIIEADERNKLSSEQKLEIQLSQGRELERPIAITQLLDLKNAYHRILDSLPSNIDRGLLEEMQIDRFLQANIFPNLPLSEQLLQEALNSLSQSSRIVQKGERIIDQGEIITPQIYDVLNSLKTAYSQRSTFNTLEQQLTRLGAFICISLLMVISSTYLLLLVPSFDRSPKNYLLLLIMGLIFVLITAFNAMGQYFSVYAIPFVMLPLLWRIFFSSYTSLVAYLPVILASALFVPEPLTFLFMQMLAGLIALISLQRLYARGQMIRAAFFVFLVYIISSIGLKLLYQGSLGKDLLNLLWVYSINLVFLMFTYLLAFMVERVFGYVSNVSLVELGDVNKPLLRELSEVAPGTFQHSLQVSILASEAALSIGADSSLIRTGALYHDIGKIKNPAYFTENQGSNNPHDLLSPEESARIIIRHVTDGIVLAQKHNLPTQIIDFIRTHHGTSMAKYFYITAQNESPDEDIDPTPYTYPGPNPTTKEQGILMLADVTEASSRSLKEYTAGSIAQHVQRIVDSIVSSGHLKDTPLTFRDIETIKEVFTSKLRTMYHTRITYPDKR